MKNSRAFTLIELLVVILIIGILAAVALPQYQKAVDKARVSELFAILRNLKVQQEIFFLQNGHYAADCEELGAELPSGFIQREERPEVYDLPKGNYTISFKCKNGNNERVNGTLIDSTDSLHVGIEIFFDHLSEDPERAGKSFCNASNKDTRSLSVCKSLGKEEKNAKSYWL